jgi:hypothetical protein
MDSSLTGTDVAGMMARPQPFSPPKDPTMLRRHLTALAGAVALLGPTAAQAQYPGLTLSFIDRTGTVAPTDVVPVWVRLALAPGADPLTFDGNAPGSDPGFLFGLPASLIPTTGNLVAPPGTTVPFAEYTSATTNTARTCSGTFSGTPGDPCGPGAYTFTFGPFFNTTLTLDPGQSTDFLFGSFTPNGGGAAPGTYRFYGATVTLNVFGEDATGAGVANYFVFLSSTTCATGDDACAFTRTVAAVSAVPEPSSVALVATGLVALAWRVRRRRTV